MIIEKLPIYDKHYDFEGANSVTELVALIEEMYNDAYPELRYMVYSEVCCGERVFSDRSDRFYDIYQHNCLRAIKALQSLYASPKSLEYVEKYSVKFYLQRELDKIKYLDLSFPFYHKFGIQTMVVYIVNFFVSVSSKEEAVCYNKILSSISIMISNEVTRQERIFKKGIMIPASLLDAIIEEIEALTVDAAKNPFYLILLQKIEIAGLKTEDFKEELDQTLEVTRSISKSLTRLVGVLNEIKGLGFDKGLHALSNGEDYYRTLIRMNSTLDISPEDVHKTGKDEVRRLSISLRVLLDKLGFDGENLRDEVQRFRSEAEKVEGIKVIPLFKKAIREVLNELPNLIDERVIDPTIPEIREYSFTGYQVPSLDGVRPGVFNFKVDDFHYRNEVKAITYHEIFPGHHLQRTYEMKHKGISTFRKLQGCIGFVEGWAQYCERLCGEYGLYVSEAEKLALLLFEIKRAALLVADTAIHYFGWEKEEVLEYLRDFAFVENSEEEYYRCLGRPAQVTFFALGKLKILDLRQKAMEELGIHFNIKEFNMEIIKDGSMPLDILEDKINNYIEFKKASHS